MRTMIYEQRKKMHIPRSELAYIIGVSLTTVANWEMGCATPNEEHQQKLDEYFKGAGDK